MAMVENETQQMVAINGARVRRLREKLGLTQLYVATVVGVTADTVSRWENGRYPTIRRENAEKLAQVLEVELAVIVGSEPLADYQARERRFSRWPVVILIAFGLFFAFAYLRGRPLFSSLSHIEARRLLPGQAAPGSVVPLIIRVSGPAAGSFILEERLPEGVRLLKAGPAPRSRARGKVRWLGVMKGGPLLYACEIRLPEGKETLSFRGILRLKGKWLPVSGAGKIVLRPCHWADTNCDLRIDDEEILAAYEMLGESPFFESQRLLLDDLWAADSYRPAKGGFVPAERAPAP